MSKSPDEEACATEPTSCVEGAIHCFFIFIALTAFYSEVLSLDEDEDEDEEPSLFVCGNYQLESQPLATDRQCWWGGLGHIMLVSRCHGEGYRITDALLTKAAHQLNVLLAVMR